MWVAAPPSTSTMPDLAVVAAGVLLEQPLQGDHGGGAVVEVGERLALVGDVGVGLGGDRADPGDRGRDGRPDGQELRGDGHAPGLAVGGAGHDGEGHSRDPSEPSPRRHDATITGCLRSATRGCTMADAPAGSGSPTSVTTAASSPRSASTRSARGSGCRCRCSTSSPPPTCRPGAGRASRCRSSIAPARRSPPVLVGAARGPLRCQAGAPGRQRPAGRELRCSTPSPTRSWSVALVVSAP